MNKETSHRRLQFAEASISAALVIVDQTTEIEVVEAGEELFIRVAGGTVVVSENGEVSFVPDSAMGL